MSKSKNAEDALNLERLTIFSAKKNKTEDPEHKREQSTESNNHLLHNCDPDGDDECNPEDYGYCSPDFCSPECFNHESKPKL
jgi:hypothetical protein